MGYVRKTHPNDIKREKKFGSYFSVKKKPQHN